MRRTSQNGVLSVKAISGTRVVLLAFDVPEEETESLLGFCLERREDGGDWTALYGDRRFRHQDDDEEASPRSDTAPIQAFLWSDYVVEPGHRYTYRVRATHGAPAFLRLGTAVEVEVETEVEDDGVHAVHFNRGVAGSRAYSRKFGEHLRYLPDSDRHGRVWMVPQIRPSDVPGRDAYEWLSRGLEEALLGFIGQAQGSRYSLRASLYELTYEPAIQQFVTALESGADVRIVHHCRQATEWFVKSRKDATTQVHLDDGEVIEFKKREVGNAKVPDAQGAEALHAVDHVGLSDMANLQRWRDMLIPRTKAAISHNKFIVLLKDGEPVQVWTGSTNLTAGGVFGQSNVGHAVRDPAVAAEYLAYWEELAEDPARGTSRSPGMKDWTVERQPDFLPGEDPPVGITPIFSPRSDLSILHWYADVFARAKRSVHLTAAFSIDNSIYEEAIQPGPPGLLRYLLLEGRGGHLKAKFPVLRDQSANRMAWGATMKTRHENEDDEAHIEALTGLNQNVSYLHTKYMLVDPLSDDPIVITGSANFSENSTTKNDENMLIIRGNTRVADIFLGEFMRLFRHFQIRNKTNALNDDDFEATSVLDESGSWAEPYFEESTQEFAERRMFAAPLSGEED